MNVDELGARLRAELEQRAAALGLRARDIQVTYQLNWGGYVNASFQAGDGRRTYHIKLTDDPYVARALAQWHRVGGMLSPRYHAPPVLGWIELADHGFAGLVFEHIRGRAPLSRDDALVHAMLPVIRELHDDSTLASALLARPRACRTTFFETYADRFAADLDLIFAEIPDFISTQTASWLRNESSRLVRQVEESAAFDEQAAAPIHGDLWLNNLLVTDDGRWYILDWDDLTIGDPALDLAMLFGPTMTDLSPNGWRDWERVLGAGPAMLERLELYSQASLLDWVIDSVADYLEADAAPEHAGLVRGERMRVHRAALALYRALYASAGTR